MMISKKRVTRLCDNCVIAQVRKFARDTIDRRDRCASSRYHFFFFSARHIMTLPAFVIFIFIFFSWRRKENMYKELKNVCCAVTIRLCTLRAIDKLKRFVLFYRRNSYLSLLIFSAYIYDPTLVILDKSITPVTCNVLNLIYYCESKCNNAKTVQNANSALYSNVRAFVIYFWSML